MKYFKVFETRAEYNTYLNSVDYIAPNVSTLRDCTEVWINGITEENDYLAFVARENATFSFTNPIEYSINSGKTWVTLLSNVPSPTIAAGEKIMWRNTASTYGTPTGVGTFSATGDFDVVGNAMSLIYGDNFANKDSLEDYPHALQYLFRYNSHIINADDMNLPAMTLSPSCYDNMFLQCYNLETAPELPAEDLEEYCYRSMFEECTSLTAMPSMGMTSVSEGSCQYMFYSATSLTTVAEKLVPEYLAVACYDSMFELCTSLVQAPELPAEELVSQCYNHMFFDCKNLNFIKAAFVTEPSSTYTHAWVGGSNSDYGVAASGNFFKGINAKWNEVSPNAIPSGWTVLSFETVYFSMTNKDEYYGCDITFTPATVGDKLYYSRDFGQTWTEYTETITTVYNENIQFKGELNANGSNGIGTFSTTGMFNVYGNVMSLIYGDNFANHTTLKANYNFAHLFEGCNRLMDAHELVLPSTTLRPHCYDSMFKDCNSVSEIPSLNAMSLAEGCYSYMFYGCKTISPLDPDYLPATTLATNCYSHMFEASGLIVTPYLLAETLVSGCYDYMFANNENMSFVQSNFTTEPGTAYTNNWLYNVSEYGVFIFNSDAPWAANYNNYRSEHGIPAYTDSAGTYTWIAQGSDYQERWIHDRYYCDLNEQYVRHEVTKEQISNDGGETWEDTGSQEDEIIAYRSMHCNFRSGYTDDEYDSEYIDTKAVRNANLIFENVDGEPNIKTDANGYVTDFEYTTASNDNPVMFNGNTSIDTVYHAFKTTGARNFKIILKAYCDGNDQVYIGGDDDNLVNLFTLRGESGGSVTYNDGFSFRLSKSAKTRLAINGNAQGVGFEKGLGIDDDGTHLWYFKIIYLDGVLTIYDLRNNKYVPTQSPWNTSGKTCDFRLDDGCSAVLACAVKSDNSYYRYCKCKFFEFKLETLEDMYAWNQAPVTDYWCEDNNKYYKEYYQLSRDGGDTWTNVEPVQVRRGALIEEASQDCTCNYFTIRSLADNNTITLKNNSGDGTKYFSASTDNGTTWSEITLTNGLTATIATINSGDTILMKGDNTRLAKAYNAGCFFRGSQDYEIEGNLASLLYSDGISREITGGTCHFAQLFSGDTHLISAENLQISSTKLYDNSFNGTFRACTNLQKAPDLSVPTVLGNETYSSMFQNCYSLSQPPAVLSATTAQLTTYRRMFFMENGSTAMTTSPLMICNFGNETELTSKCQIFSGNNNLSTVRCFWTNDSGTFNNLTEWMKNVASTGTFYKRSTQSFAEGINGIPTGWTVVNDDTTIA